MVFSNLQYCMLLGRDELFEVFNGHIYAVSYIFRLQVIWLTFSKLHGDKIQQFIAVLIAQQWALGLASFQPVHQCFGR